MKVLLGWELGAGQGHIQRLTAIAQRLTLHGIEPIFALKSDHLRGMSFPWQSLAAPRLPFSGRENSYTFADILATFGFSQPDLLRPHLQQWQDILKTVAPDVVMTDHAPGLVLAAQGLVPTLVLGSHFAVPPPVDIFPAFRSAAPAEVEERQWQVSETVRRVVKLDAPLGQLLNGDRSFIFSIPELDFYRDLRQASQTTQYVGIHMAPLPQQHASGAGTPWAYLAKDYPFYNLVCNTLNPDLGFKPLQEALVDRSIAIHHGGLTTTVACLLAGIPQLILPRHLEQQLNARAVLQLDTAQILIAPTTEDLQLAEAEVSELADNARWIAQRLSHWNHNFLDEIVQSCLQLI